MSKHKVIIIIAAVVAILTGAVLVSFFVFASKKEEPMPIVASESKRQLLFQDEFDGDKLDKTKWNTCYDNFSIEYSGCTNYGNNENEWYVADNVSVKNGNLVLTSQKDGTNGQDGNNEYKWYPYKSGMVSTGRYIEETPEKWSGTYGYYEARIKVPSGQAIWPAFWLLPVSGEWPPEIDIMEVLGQSPNELLTTYHWKTEDGKAAQDSALYINNESLSDDWHTYSVNWTATSIDWYLDGKNVKHVESDNVPDVAMQIVLNLAVGGNLPGYPDETTPINTQMLVDYVRVYR